MSTKIHAAADSLGEPVRLIGGPGQENDIQRGNDLIEGFSPGHVLADKAYDADRFHASILNAGAEVVIPPKRNRRVQHAYDKDIYKERNRIERFFNKLKHFRRIATRFDKLARNFLAAVALASTRIWIRTYESTTWLCPARPGQQKRRPEAAFSLMGWPAFRTTTHQDRYIICFGGSVTLASVRAFSRTGMPAA